MPRALVQRQLIESFSGKDFETSTDNEFIGPLDDWQRDASRASGPAIVIGSRGTGKTTVLLARCSYLVNEFNADPRRILVVAASQLQADFIRQNLFSRIIDLSLISVSTPGQLAYDILVRFGKELDLTLPWEDVDAKNDGKTMGRRLIDAALNLARNYPVLLEKLRGRFDHIMIDSVNLMNQSALDVVQAAVSSEQALWMSVTREAYELAVRHTSNPRYFSLPCQYRVAPAINRWISALRGIDEKHDLDHRAENPRSGRGTVTIAVAETSDQLASGIEEFLHSKFHDRYSLDDVLIACPPSSTKLYAALQTKIFRALSADEITEKKYIGDFQCWLELCANNWSAPTLFQIGRLPEYDLEPGGLFQAAQDCLATTDFNGRLDLLRKSFGEAGLRLAEQLSGSCTVRSNRERLLTYLFELSDYVRARPGCGHAIERFLTEIDLDASRSNTGFVGQATRQHVIRSSNDLLSRHNKIAVVTECDIVELLTIISGRGRVESVNREIGAAAAASEHLLYGVVTKKPLKALDSAGKIKRSTPWIEIRDWTGIKSHTAENAISSSKASEDKALFKQCPRRVYYRRALDSAETIPSDLINYPAKPADVSLCAACLYKLICPSLIS